MKRTNWFLCILVLIGIFLVQVHPGWTSPIFESEPNDSFDEAQNLDGNFSIDFNEDIFNSNMVPHVSVQATNGPTVSDVDYYSFSVAEAGQTAYFDIDYGLIDGTYIDDVNTTLSLFDSTYNLLAFSDDSSSETDPGTVSIRDSFIGEYAFNVPGTYYIVVSNWGNYPTVKGTEVGPLFRPDGVEAGVEYAGDSGPAEVTAGFGTWIGDYTLHVSLSEAASPIPEPIIVPVDVKPGSCSNPLNIKSKGVFSVAILGTNDFSVQDVEESSIVLEGVSPIKSDYEDVATPFEPGMEKLSDFDCPDEGPDGFLDLVLKFETQEVLEAVEASLDRDLDDGEVVWLTLHGNLMEQFDSAAIEGEDAIVILRKGKK
jgi:hypothetical protein